MREDNFGNKEEIVNDIVNQIWTCTNILYKAGKLDAARLVLFLISTYKDGLLPSPYINEQKNSVWLNEFANRIQNDSFYKKIFNIYASEIAHIHHGALGEVIYQLNQVDSNKLRKNFPEIFEALLKKYIDYEGKRSGEIIQPKEISNLMIELADLRPNAKVYNPFAGLASFGILLKKNQEYHGQEINSFTWAIGQLRLKAHNKGYAYGYQRDDSINHWHEFQKFDLVVASPPFYVPIPNHFHSRFSEQPYGKVQNFLIDKGIQSLKDNGRLITVFPLSFLFGRSRSEKKLKKWLIQNDLVDTVIVLPSGLLSNTNISVCIVIIKKISIHPGYVRMIDASDCFTKDGPRKKTLKGHDLFELINNDSENEFLRYVSTSEVSKNNYNLTPSGYLITNDNKLLLKKGTPLRELVSAIEDLRNRDIQKSLLAFGGPIALAAYSFSKGNIFDKYKTILIKDLKNDPFDFVVNTNELERTKEIKKTKIISSPCLLLALTGNYLKPSYIEDTNDKLFNLSKGIIALRVDTKKVDVQWLIHELHSENTNVQLEAFRSGSTIPYINKEDLLSVKLLVPSISEQKAKVLGAKEAYVQSKKRELELQQELLGVKDDSFREFASMRHTLRQYLNALKANVRGTKKFLERKEDSIIDLNEIYSQNLNQTFGEHILSIEKTIDSMSGLLTPKKDKVNNNGVKEQIRIIELIKEAQKRFTNIELFIFEKLYIDEESFKWNGKIKDPIVEIDKEDFLILFSNVVFNAVDHGFVEPKKYIIRAELSYNSEREQCVLEISNNGRPFPDKFSQKHLITRGEKTSNSKGTGVGGADINDVIKKYDWEFELIGNDKGEFPVKYIFKFPLFTQFD
ncbi:N-6 DNA methylase [Galbibacter orientalis]|uniref:N-6 DNA methylase n=1 Tax=Galbibacter orientalis TaxID=453852 RepID=UPI00308036EE